MLARTWAKTRGMWGIVGSRIVTKFPCSQLFSHLIPHFFKKRNRLLLLLLCCLSFSRRLPSCSYWRHGPPSCHFEALTDRNELFFFSKDKKQRPIDRPAGPIECARVPARPIPSHRLAALHHQNQMGNFAPGHPTILIFAT